MSLSFIYRSPTTPAGAGWTVDLGTQAVRLGNIQGLVTEAELGAVGSSSLAFDDPTGTAGHSNDAIVGLKQFSVNASACPSGNRRVWEGYIADRRYSRGTPGSTSPSLRTEAARIIDMTLVDLNSFLSFRVFQPTSLDATSSFNRPAETDLERLTALLAVDFISTTLFDNGLVSTTAAVDMDANDYAGQRPNDVLNDCAQQSGKNFFVYYDESAGQFSLFYDFNDSPVYPAYDTDLKVSNVLADIDVTDHIPTGPIWPPLIDAVLVRDPSRVISGALALNGSNSYYGESLQTSYTYAYRDAVIDTQNLKTVAKIGARVTRYLQENNTEDDRITFTLKLPEANLNDWKEGQYAPVKFSHLPGYEDYVNVRCLQRTVAQDEETDEWFNVRYEVAPMNIVGTPSGATDAQKVGVSYSGIPELPRPTTPGNVLLAVMLAAGNTTKFPTSFRAKDNPALPPASAEVLPFPDADGWTVIGTATTDYSGQNIGGPCGMSYQGPFHGGAGVCTSGAMVAAAWRYVQAGEVTTTPAQFSTEILDSATLTYLWELPTTTAPTGTYHEDDGNNSAAPSACTQTLPSITGNAFAVFFYQLAAGHGSTTNPVSAANATGEPDAIKFRDDAVKAITGAHFFEEENSTDITDPNTQNWVQMQQLPTGGVAEATITPNAAYTSLNWCGLVFEIPPGVVIPDIPYPANQSA